MKPLKKAEWFKVTAIAIAAVVTSIVILVGMALLLTGCMDAESADDIYVKNIHAATGSAYDIGDNTTRFRTGYFDNVTGRFIYADNASLGELWITDNTSIHVQDGSGFGGLPGPQGPIGPPGPNNISTSTSTSDIPVGYILTSDGSHVSSVANIMHTQGTDTTLGTTTADIQIGSGYNINLINNLTSNNSWSGLVSDFTAGHALSAYNVCYIDAFSKLEKADASAVATTPVIAMATASMGNGNTGTFITYGYIRYDTWNWTINGLIYLDSTAGSITQTPPTGSGKQIQIVGVAVTAHIIFFNPNNMILELK